MSKSYTYKKILIIEDDEIFLKPLVKFLTLHKLQVNDCEVKQNEPDWEKLSYK